MSTCSFTYAPFEPETKTLSHSMEEREVESFPVDPEEEDDEEEEDDDDEEESDSDAEDSYSDLASSNEDENDDEENVQTKPKQVKAKGDVKGKKTGEIPFVFKGMIGFIGLFQHILYK